MPKERVNGIDIYYDGYGQGDPVLLLAGLPGVGKAWAPQIPLFSKHYLTIVPDHRGAGQSSRPDTGYTIEEHATDFAELLRKLGCGPAHIIGSSTGGAICQAMAFDHPDVVRTITVASSWAVPDDYFRHQFQTRKRILQESGPRAYADLSALFLFSPDYFRRHYYQVRQWCDAAASAAADPVIMGKRTDMIINSDQRGGLARIERPVLVIVGSHDACAPPYFSEELASLIPGAELAILEGGHLIYREDPEGFHSRVAEFIRQH
jgi:aminoacrylate hydrolase